MYDHLDFLVHPLGAHLTERVATQFWVRGAPRAMQGRSDLPAGSCKSTCAVEMGDPMLPQSCHLTQHRKATALDVAAPGLVLACSSGLLTESMAAYVCMLRLLDPEQLVSCNGPTAAMTRAVPPLPGCAERSHPGSLSPLYLEQRPLNLVPMTQEYFFPKDEETAKRKAASQSAADLKSRSSSRRCDVLHR